MALWISFSAQLFIYEKICNTHTLTLSRDYLRVKLEYFCVWFSNTTLTHWQVLRNVLEKLWMEGFLCAKSKNFFIFGVWARRFDSLVWIFLIYKKIKVFLWWICCYFLKISLFLRFIFLSFRKIALLWLISHQKRVKRNFASFKIFIIMKNDLISSILSSIQRIH